MMRNWRVGMLMNRHRRMQKASPAFCFVQTLQQTTGQNLRVDIRWGAGDVDRFRKYASELVALDPDVILGCGWRDGSTIVGGHPHHPHRVRANAGSSRYWLRG